MGQNSGPPSPHYPSDDTGSIFDPGDVLTAERNNLEQCFEDLDGRLLQPPLQHFEALDGGRAAGDIAKTLEGATDKFDSIVKNRGDVAPLPTRFLFLSRRLASLCRFRAFRWEDDARDPGVQHQVDLIVRIALYLAEWCAPAKDCGLETLEEKQQREIRESVANAFELWAGMLDLPKEAAKGGATMDEAAYASRFWTSLDVPHLADVISKFEPMLLTGFLHGFLNEINRTGAESSNHLSNGTAFVGRVFRADPKGAEQYCHDILVRLIDLVKNAVAGNDYTLARKRLHCLLEFLRCLGFCTPGDSANMVRNQFREFVNSLTEAVCEWKRNPTLSFLNYIYDPANYPDLYRAVVGEPTSFFDRLHLKDDFHPRSPTTIHGGPAFDLLSQSAGLEAVRLKLERSKCEADSARPKIELNNGDWSPLDNCRFVLPYDDDHRNGEIAYLVINKANLYHQVDIDWEGNSVLILVRTLQLVIARNQNELDGVVSGKSQLIYTNADALTPFRDFVRKRHRIEIEIPNVVKVFCVR